MSHTNNFGPMSPEMRDRLRREQEAKYRKEYIPTPFDAATVASEMAAAQPKINTEDLINEVVSRNLAKYKAAEDKVPTPVFKVGEMVHNTKGAVSQEEFDMFNSEEVSLPGMMDVVNSGDIRPTIDSSNIDLSGIGDNVTLDDFNWNPTEAEITRAGLSKFKSITPQLSNKGDSTVTHFPVRDKDNKISGYEKKPSWIEGNLSMVADPTNKTPPKDPTKGMGLKYGVDFNTQFDSFDKKNVSTDKDVYQMLQELEGNWK